MLLSGMSSNNRRWKADIEAGNKYFKEKNYATASLLLDGIIQDMLFKDNDASLNPLAKDAPAPDLIEAAIRLRLDIAEIKRNADEPLNLEDNWDFLKRASAWMSWGIAPDEAKLWGTVLEIWESVVNDSLARQSADVSERIVWVLSLPAEVQKLYETDDKYLINWERLARQTADRRIRHEILLVTQQLSERLSVKWSADGAAVCSLMHYRLNDWAIATALAESAMKNPDDSVWLRETWAFISLSDFFNRSQFSSVENQDRLVKCVSILESANGIVRMWENAERLKLIGRAKILLGLYPEALNVFDAARINNREDPELSWLAALAAKGAEAFEHVDMIIDNRESPMTPSMIAWSRIAHEAIVSSDEPPNDTFIEHPLTDDSRTDPFLQMTMAHHALQSGHPVIANQILAKVDTDILELKTAKASLEFRCALALNDQDAIHRITESPEFKWLPPYVHHLWSGIDLAKRGDNQSAERLFRMAIKARPRDPTPHYALGVLLMKSQRSSARHEFEEAIRLSPGHNEALIGLACMACYFNDYDQALQHAETLLRRNPRNADCRLLCDRFRLLIAGQTGRIDHNGALIIENVMMENRPTVSLRDVLTALLTPLIRSHAWEVLTDVVDWLSPIWDAHQSQYLFARARLDTLSPSRAEQDRGMAALRDLAERYPIEAMESLLLSVERWMAFQLFESEGVLASLKYLNQSQLINAPPLRIFRAHLNERMGRAAYPNDPCAAKSFFEDASALDPDNPDIDTLLFMAKIKIGAPPESYPPIARIGELGEHSHFARALKAARCGDAKACLGHLSYLPDTMPETCLSAGALFLRLWLALQNEDIATARDRLRDMTHHPGAWSLLAGAGNGLLFWILSQPMTSADETMESHSDNFTQNASFSSEASDFTQRLAMIFLDGIVTIEQAHRLAIKFALEGRSSLALRAFDLADRSESVHVKEQHIGYLCHLATQAAQHEDWREAALHLERINVLLNQPEGAIL